MYPQFKSIVLIALLITLVGCSSESSKTDSDVAQMAQKASTKLINNFSRSLKSELLAALNEGGPSHAIGVCQMRAPEIESQAGKERLITVRRVSEKNRNPENEADKHESLILNTFASSTEPAPDHFDEWITIDSVKHYRFYKPIYTQELCLQCHGQTKQIDDATAATINSLYPEDKATGYSAGDLRGMFVVDMKWPEAKEAVESIVSDSL